MNITKILRKNKRKFDFNDKNKVTSFTEEYYSLVRRPLNYIPIDSIVKFVLIN